MKKILFFISLVSCASALLSVVSAQNNLSISFDGPSSVPSFLNICGEADTETVLIQTDGISPALRTNVRATARLFKGVEFVALDAANSTAGVTVDDTDPNQPIFNLPDIGSGGLSNVRLSFSILADCGYIDTLRANSALIVQDEWEFNYEISGNQLTEIDLNTEYRDAFAVPVFTLNETPLPDAAKA